MQKIAGNQPNAVSEYNIGNHFRASKAADTVAGAKNHYPDSQKYKQFQNIANFIYSGF